jgi:hypothetical protein
MVSTFLYANKIRNLPILVNITGLSAAPGSKALNYWNFSEIIEASSSAA